MTMVLLAVLFVITISHSASALEPDEDKFSAACEDSVSLNRLTRRPAPSDCRQRERTAETEVARAQIVNGEVAPDERYTAAIIYRGEDGKRHICSGVSVDARHVLTAGHCACGKSGSYSVSFKQKALNGNQVNGAIEIEGVPILFDPLTCIRGARPGYDLALIRLKGRLLDTDPQNFGYPAFALAADLQEQLRSGTPLKVVGFGETETGGIATRMKANVPILTSDCFERPYNFYCASFLEMILAQRTGNRGPRDTCGGDSGGPVFASMQVPLPACPSPGKPFRPEEKITQPQDVLVATTSRAAPFTHPLGVQHCGGGGVYTLIGRRSVHAWLEENRVNPQRCVIEIKK